MFNQKGFSKVVIIIIVLILIGGAYFVFSEKDKNIPSQNNENQSSQSNQSIGGDLSMSDWKTYRNDQYGFEIKFPKNWLVEDNEINEFDYKKIEFIEPTNKYILSIGIIQLKIDAPNYSHLGNKDDYVDFDTNFGVIWRNKKPLYSNEEDYYYFELQKKEPAQSQDYDSLFSTLIKSNFSYFIFYDLPKNLRYNSSTDSVDYKIIETMDTMIKTLKFTK